MNPFVFSEGASALAQPGELKNIFCLKTETQVDSVVGKPLYSEYRNPQCKNDISQNANNRIQIFLFRIH